MDRRTLNALVSLGGLRSARDRLGLSLGPTPAAGPQNQQVPWPSRTFRRLLIDTHVPDWDHLLADFDAADYVSTIAGAGFQSQLQTEFPCGPLPVAHQAEKKKKKKKKKNKKKYMFIIPNGVPAYAAHCSHTSVCPPALSSLSRLPRNSSLITTSRAPPRPEPRRPSATAHTAPSGFARKRTPNRRASSIGTIPSGVLFKAPASAGCGSSQMLSRKRSNRRGRFLSIISSAPRSPRGSMACRSNNAKRPTHARETFTAGRRNFTGLQSLLWVDGEASV